MSNADAKPAAPKLTIANSKQEMLAAYSALRKQIEEQGQIQLKPEKQQEERKAQEAVRAAETLSSDGVMKGVTDLRLEVGKLLTGLTERLEDQVAKFNAVRKAIEVKQGELKEMYDIEAVAASLVALIEAQNRKRAEFEAEMAEEKANLSSEIETTRAEWIQEKKTYEAAIKERDAVETRRREREKEEYVYVFKREQQVARDKVEDEKAKLEKQVQLRKEELERELKERTKAVKDAEAELTDLRQRAQKFPAELQAAVARVVKETTERLQADAKNALDLVRKEFEGERNVLTARNEALLARVKQLEEQNAKVTRQQELAYEKVQDIAVKAIEGASAVKATAAQAVAAERDAARAKPAGKEG